MSYVSSMILICALIEEDEDGGLPAFHQWCRDNGEALGRRQGIEFRLLDLEPAVNGKAMQCRVLACAANYVNHEALMDVFPIFPWIFPENAVLVVEPENGETLVLRADGMNS